MTMPVIFYLVGAAIVPIAFHFISRRDSRLLARDELDHAIETLPRIQRQLRELLELHQAQRAALAKATVNAMRDDCSFLIWLIFRRLQLAQLFNQEKRRQG